MIGGVEGKYAGPAGHLEYGESFEEGIRREVKEETGGGVKNLKFTCVINLKTEGRHYVDVGFTGEWEGGDPELCEPARCAGWGWYTLDNLPSPLGEFDADFIEAYKTGRNYFDN